MVGQTISHYRLLEKLGEGGMGVVYKALDLHLDRPVAIKILSPEAVRDQERKRRFVQEAKAASALNHPNIVHVYDIDTAQGVDFISMEYVPGKNLAELIGRKGLPIREALKCAARKSVRRNAAQKWELAALGVPEGREKKVTPLDLPVSANVSGFSLHPSGRSFATSVGTARYDIWLLEGFPQPGRWRFR